MISACQEPSPATMQTWVLLGLYLFLALMGRIIVRLIFNGVSGTCKTRTLYKRFEGSFMLTVSVIVSVLFLILALSVIPFSCRLTRLRSFCYFVLYMLLFGSIWVLVGSMFEFSEIMLHWFNQNTWLLHPVIDGIRVAKVLVLLFLGILFFATLVAQVEPNTEFTLAFFFVDTNVVSFMWVFFLIPLLRDAIGGASLLADSGVLEIGDWIDLAGYCGYVERIGLFTVGVRSLNGTVAHIPCGRFMDSVFTISKANRNRKNNVFFPLMYFPTINGTSMELALAQDDTLQRLLESKLTILLTNQGFSCVTCHFSMNDQGHHGLFTLFDSLPTTLSPKQQMNDINQAVTTVLSELSASPANERQARVQSDPWRAKQD